MSGTGWSESFGEYGTTVRVWERLNDDGDVTSIYMAYRTSGGEQKRRSLGHKDRSKAKEQAFEMHMALSDARERMERGKVTLTDICAAFQREETPNVGKRRSGTHERVCDAWRNFLGSEKDPLEITPREYAEFARQRKKGIIDSRGYRVKKEDDRQPVKDGTVWKDLYLLRTILAWASEWQRSNGRFLLPRNPLRGRQFKRVLDAYEEEDANKDRPVMDSERFAALLPEIADLKMRVTWQDGYSRIPTYLPVLLELYRVFGRRCSEFREFRRKHVDFDPTPDAPHGRLRIPREFSKQDKRDEIELTQDLREMLQEHIARMSDALGIAEGKGDTPLFPAPKDPTRPVRYATIRKWFVKAEENAGLEHREQGGFHELRRWYATKMKDHPHQDEVAEIAGWADQYSMRAHGYTQTEPEKRRSVIEESESRG